MRPIVGSFGSVNISARRFVRQRWHGAVRYRREEGAARAAITRQEGSDDADATGIGRLARGATGTLHRDGGHDLAESAGGADRVEGVRLAGGRVGTGRI